MEKKIFVGAKNSSNYIEVGIISLNKTDLTFSYNSIELSILYLGFLSVNEEKQEIYIGYFSMSPATTRGLKIPFSLSTSISLYTDSTFLGMKFFVDNPYNSSEYIGILGTTLYYKRS